MENIKINGLDAIDRRLLREIDLNARLGTSALGKRLRVSQEGIHYRLKRLEKRGIISGYLTFLNFGKIGFTGYGVYCRFQNVTLPTKERILESLKKNPHVYWIAEFGGRYDVAFAIMARNINEFNEIFTELTTEHQKFIKDPTIAIRAELIEFPRKYLAKTEERLNNHPRFGKFIEAEKLDATDKNILRIITQHPRESILEISKQIAVSPATARARLKDLEKRQIIQGYGAKINCQKFGYQSYQLFITAHNLTKENKKRLISYCEHHPNIIFYIETVGKWQFELIYELEDQKKLQECVIEMRTAFQDMILDMESIVLFDHYVKYNQFPFYKIV